MASGGNGIRQYFGVPEARLTSPLMCHIMQIFNVSESKEKALEEWKYYQNPNKAPFERMEHVNRPIIYGVDLDAGGTDLDQKLRVAKATFKLLMRDAFGNFFYAIELEELPFLRNRKNITKTPLPIPLGGRLVLQEGTLVAEGIVLLTLHQCTYMEPDPNAQMTRMLNDGMVTKTIETIERLLKHPE